MHEDFLQFAWLHHYFEGDALVADTNETVAVVGVGEPNTDSGPDFFNACIKLNGIAWCGNVEIHVSSSDWYRHGHHTDDAYNNVVLHVVKHHDKSCYTAQGRLIPTVELPYFSGIYERYEHLMQMESWIACAPYINMVSDLEWHSWNDALVVERLQRKTEHWQTLLKSVDNHLEEAFYIHLVRSLGMNTNGQPFEMLARATPLRILARQRNNLLQLEAMLFGQAGMLEQTLGDEYYQHLRKEYLHLHRKYKLESIPSHLWKFMRLRPVNFPTIRIAQLAVLIFQSSHLIDKILATDTLKGFEQLFDVAASDYWNTHYRFMKNSSFKRKRMGQKMLHAILINTVVPFLFMYAQHMGSQQYRQRAMQLLQMLPPEDNSTIVHWQELGLHVSSAMDTQGLLQLKKHYCNQKKCLSCRIGRKLVTLIGN